MRIMVFVDHMNFTLGVNDLFRDCNMGRPQLDYSTLFKTIAGLSGDAEYVGTKLFTAKPDIHLMQIPKFKSRYLWEKKLDRFADIDVIDGELRQSKDGRIYEKGVDVNLGSYLVHLAHKNAFDAAYILSGDSDFSGTYELVTKEIGKKVYVMPILGQNIDRIIEHATGFRTLNMDVFAQCVRT